MNDEGLADAATANPFALPDFTQESGRHSPATVRRRYAGYHLGAPLYVLRAGCGAVAEATEYDRSRLADGVLYNRSIRRRGQGSLNLFRIVHVRAYSPSFEWRDYGLGCLISAELVVTASHVIRHVETQVENVLYIQRFDAVNSCDGIGLLPAFLMFRDEDQDVALLRLQRTPPTFQSSLSRLREPNLRPLTELRPDEAVSCYLAPPLGGEQGHFDPAPESLMLQRLRLLEQTRKEKRWFLTESPRFGFTEDS